MGKGRQVACLSVLWSLVLVRAAIFLGDKSKRCKLVSASKPKPFTIFLMGILLSPLPNCDTAKHLWPPSWSRVAPIWEVE